MRSEAQWGRPEGMVMGIGTLENIRIRLCVAEFGFMGGSMGCVMGEKIAQTLIRASREDCGVLIVSASGGARMQEGLLSLMQMAKVMAALAEFRKGVRPFVSLLTNPTTGGVAASYALLGDIHIAEPGALIGFAGPRVIKDTLGVRLPEGFQKAETLLRLGMIDRIEPRAGQRAFLAKIFKMLGMKRGMDAP
jgi:acetyl-CoA carboxylase carboxyl transferase subunit beta